MARVLLVEDDASIRRFVQMALEDQPLTLLLASTLAEARAVLAAGAVDLLLSDLMLPDGSGAELLRELADSPAHRAGMRLVAFSAGISPARRAQLMALGIDEILPKPVALAALQACVQQALAVPAALSNAAGAAAPAAAEAAAIAEYFGGSAGLFQAYLASCRQQFTADLAEGDDALARADLAALRRLVHSLKTVLLTLGQAEAAALAAWAENLAASEQAAQAWDAWSRLRGRLQALAV